MGPTSKGDPLVLIVLIIVLGIIGFGCLGLAAAINKQKVALYDRISSEHRPDELFVDGAGHFVGFRFSDQKVIYGQHGRTNVIPMSSITSVDVRKNGVSITKVNRGSQLAGVAVGGLFLGLPGAVVGGLSGSSKTAERLKSIGLTFTFDHEHHPSHQVQFGAWPADGVAEGGIQAAQAIATMDRFRARAVNALRAGNRGA